MPRRQVILAAPTRLVAASRLADVPPPLDGRTASRRTPALATIAYGELGPVLRAALGVPVAASPLRRPALRARPVLPSETAAGPLLAACQAKVTVPVVVLFAAVLA